MPRVIILITSLSSLFWSSLHIYTVFDTNDLELTAILYIGENPFKIRLMQQN